MRTPAGAPLGVASLFALACTGTTEPPVKVAAVVPAQAFNNQEVAVVILGGPFRPAYDIDTVVGSAVTQLGAFSAVLSPTSGVGGHYAAHSPVWLDTSTLAASIPLNLPKGDYDVQVRDPRGNVGQRTGAYTSLGPDDDAPVVTIAEPRAHAVVNAGAEIPVATLADDGPGELGTLSWAVSDATGQLAAGTCSVDPNAAKETCRFVFVAPGKPETLTISVDARDSAGNDGTATSTVVVATTPVGSTGAPREGVAAGGTSLTVTGASFVEGTQVLVDGAPLLPNGGTFVDAGTIQGTTPAHEPGLVRVVVRSGAVDVDAGPYTYVGRPVVYTISPTTGPLTGNIPVVLGGRNFRTGTAGDGTTIEFGALLGPRAPLGCLEVVSDNRITGLLPAGTGAPSIFANDPVGGTSQLDLAFTYLDAATDAGVAPPVTCDQARFTP